MTSNVWVRVHVEDQDERDIFVRGSDITGVGVRTRKRMGSGAPKADAMVEFQRGGDRRTLSWLFSSRDLADKAAAEVVHHLSETATSGAVLTLGDDESVKMTMI